MSLNIFITSLDLTRQSKILSGETATLDGKIQTGIPFSSFPTGVDTGTTTLLSGITSENAIFSGNNTTTLFDVSNPSSPNYNVIFSGLTGTSWTNPIFSASTSGLTLPITNFSADTQVVGPYWTLTQTGMTGDYVIGLEYTGYTVTYFFNNVNAITLSGMSGTTTIFTGLTSALQQNYSAGTLDYKGPLDYISSVEDATVSGRTITNKLTVSGGATSGTVGYVLTQTDNTGKAEWMPFSGSGSGGTSYWSASTGTNGIVVKYSESVAGGVLAIGEGFRTTANGDYSHAEGLLTIASGDSAHSEGYLTNAFGDNSHAEGRETTAIGGYGSHAEGYITSAIGNFSHAEGWGSRAEGNGSHAEGGVYGGEPNGFGGYAFGDASHAEGISTSAMTYAAHAEGYRTLSNGIASHTEGSQTTASANGAHAEGYRSVAGATNTHAEGYQTSATTTNAHSEGYQTLASGDTSHAEGNQTVAGGLYSHSEGNVTTALEVASHAEGESTISNGYASHTEGYDTRTNADYTHAEGESVISGWRGFSVDSVTNGVITLNSTYGDVTSEFTSGTIILDKLKINYSTITFSSTTNTEIIITNTILNSGTYVNDLNNLNSLSADNIIGSSSHAEGKNTRALGNRSHAEGFGSLTTGSESHAEGAFTQATNDASHAEGYFTVANGVQSHSQNRETNARGFASHAEGNSTRAIGQYSHSEGSDTYAGYAGFNVISVVNGLVTLDSSYGDQTGLFSIGSTAIIDNKLSVITNSTFSSTTNTEIFLTDTSINVGSAIGITYDINNEFADTFGGNVTHAEGYQNKSFGDYSHTQNSFNTAIGSNTHAGGTNSMASGTTSFIHSTNSLVIADRSVVLGGQNITGTTTDTVYVPYLNIKNVGSGTSVNNLGIDVNGNVVSGTTGGGTLSWVTRTNLDSANYTIGTNVGVIDERSGLTTTYTLPASPNVGDRCLIIKTDESDTPGLLRISGNTGQSMLYTNFSTTLVPPYLIINNPNRLRPNPTGTTMLGSIEFTYVGSNRWVVTNYTFPEDPDSF